MRDLTHADVRIASRVRGVTRQVYRMLRDISQDPTKHGRLQALVTYQLTNDILTEKGKAAQMAAEMRKIYGTPDVAGFRFYVSRSSDDSEEYLSVVFNPRWVVPGRWQAHKAKVDAAKERKRKKREAG